jgi:NADH dehydrogenase
VWVEDVARAVVHCLTHKTTVGQTVELAGPDVFSLRELAEMAGQAAGTPRLVMGLPRALAYFQALVMEYMPGEPLMSTDNLSSLEMDNVASPGMLTLADWGITPASLRAVLPTYIGRVTGGNGPRNRLLGFRAKPR